MLFVEQRDRRSQVQLASKGRIAMVHAIQSLSVTHQNAERSFAGRGRDFDRNLPNHALATVRSQHGFYEDLITGTGFGDIGPGAFQPCPAALAHQVEVQFYAIDGGSVVGVVIDASEALSQR